MSDWRQSRCLLCGREGPVRVKRVLKNRTANILDGIDHADDCPRKKRAQPKHLKKQAWRSTEKGAAALVGGRETLRSGAENMDGDVRTLGAWRVENKSTRSDRYRLKGSTWTDFVQGALAAGEEPLLRVVFTQHPHITIVLARAAALEGHLPDRGALPLTRGGVTFARRDYPEPLEIPLEPRAVVMSEAAFRRFHADSGRSSSR